MQKDVSAVRTISKMLREDMFGCSGEDEERIGSCITRKQNNSKHEISERHMWISDCGDVKN